MAFIDARGHATSSFVRGVGTGVSTDAEDVSGRQYTNVDSITNAPHSEDSLNTR